MKRILIVLMGSLCLCGHAHGAVVRNGQSIYDYQETAFIGVGQLCLSVACATAGIGCSSVAVYTTKKIRSLRHGPSTESQRIAQDLAAVGMASGAMGFALIRAASWLYDVGSENIKQAQAQGGKYF